MSKISAYSAIASVQSDDLLVVVDVHDTTMAPSGTTKKMTLSQLPCVPASEVGAANGVASLDSGGKVPAGELPAATTSVQGAVILDGTASDIQPAGVAAAGGKGQAADAKHVHPLQAWQFMPEGFGAKGDGRVVGDGAITSGQAVFTSATAGFTSADAGKAIMVNGAGSGGLTLCTTISGYTNATTVTLAANASSTVTGASALYGTDDTAAFQSLAQAMNTYMATGWKAQAILGSKIYCLAGTPYQTGNGSTTPTYNSLFPMLYPNANGTTQAFIPEIIGPGDASQCQYFESVIPNLQGAVLACMSYLATSGTFGQPSVIGGPSSSAGFTGGFANIKPFVTGVTVVAPVISSVIGYDFRYCAGKSVDRWAAQAFASVLGDSSGIPLPHLPALTSFQSATGVGLWAPLATNNDKCDAGTGAVEGFPTAVRYSEHFTWQRLALIYANIGQYIDLTGGSVIHGASGTYLSCEATNAVIHSNGGNGTQFPLRIGLVDVEVINTADVQDSGNSLTGEIHWADFGRATPTISGASNLRVVNDRLGPGHMASPPSVPGSASTAALVYRDAWVTVHTGSGVTVSAVTVDGTATGLTMTASSTLAVFVPSGKTVALTYSGGTPTWDWWLA